MYENALQPPSSTHTARGRNAVGSNQEVPEVPARTSASRVGHQARPGVSFIDVTLASIILMVGILGSSRFFVNVYEQLSPRGDEGGLRRFLLAEQLLVAQAEGLRVLQTIPADSISDLKLVTEPKGSKFILNVRPTIVSNTSLQYVFYDISVTNDGIVVGRLSTSTLRSAEVSQDEKIGI